MKSIVLIVCLVAPIIITNETIRKWESLQDKYEDNVKIETSNKYKI